MWFLILLILCASYIGCGFVASKVEAKCKKEGFKADWNKILTWPKDVFGKPEADKPEEK